MTKFERLLVVSNWWTELLDSMTLIIYIKQSSMDPSQVGNIFFKVSPPYMGTEAEW